MRVHYQLYNEFDVNLRLDVLLNTKVSVDVNLVAANDN